MANEVPAIPLDMRKIFLRLRRWRSSHARRVPLPDSLWAAAGELARQHGTNRTAKALHLEYGKLKERAVAAGLAAAQPAKRLVRKVPSVTPRRARTPAPPTFMELITPRPGSVASAVVELEGPHGRMKIEFKGVAPAELVALSRPFWDGGA
jgi:hypothetical protein